MGLFDKVNCASCGKECRVNYKIIDGAICKNCHKLSGYDINKTSAVTIAKKTIEDVKNDITNTEMENEKYIQKLTDFNPTKKMGTYIEFDEEKKQWLIPDGFYGKKIKPHIYNYDDIIDFELLEDGESISKGGLGRAVAGGILFGGVGAIVGGATGGKKSKAICTSLMIKITVNDLNNPTVYINYITTATKNSSLLYKAAYQNAQNCLSTLQLVRNSNQKSLQNNINTETTVSGADEILKFKNLLDNGIITQEEFEAKKKQLLGL